MVTLRLLHLASNFMTKKDFSSVEAALNHVADHVDQKDYEWEVLWGVKVRRSLIRGRLHGVVFTEFTPNERGLGKVREIC